MSIRKKILLYFSIIPSLITGAAFVIIYFVFAANREEVFQLRQKEKITTTLKLLAKIKQTEDDLIEELDRLTIHDLYDEKLLLFNAKKELIYSSLDDTPVPISRALLSQLNTENKWVETQEGMYDVVGTYLEHNGTIYYGISKAHDTFGYSKQKFLKVVLLLAFIIIVLVIGLISVYLSKKVTEPLSSVAEKINNYDFNSIYTPLVFSDSKNEIAILANQFNNLVKRMNEVFAFQKHAVNHISHELKTPIAILVSNFERIEKESDPEKLKALIAAQKEETKSLGEIINSLLEIAKAESTSQLQLADVRVDDLVFDLTAELSAIHPYFRFSVDYEFSGEEQNMSLKANPRLLKAALQNLMINCINYSSDNKAAIIITSLKDHIEVRLINKGAIISAEESPFLFQHFFRGANSKGKPGFGLGLVFVNRIVALHKGTTSYHSTTDSNVFTIAIPLS